MIDLFIMRDRVTEWLAACRTYTYACGCVVGGANAQLVAA